MLFDWDNWHALDDAIGPVREKQYQSTVAKHYQAFYRKNIPVDIVFPDSDLSKYTLVIAPMMYMVKEGLAEKVEALLNGGGSFVTTYFSGRVDETDLAFENGYPGPLSKVLGIWIEEIDAMYSGQTNTIVMGDGRSVYTCNHLADLIHAESAEVLATFGSDFYAGMPVVTKNDYGKGSAYFIASNPEDQFLDHFYEDILRKHGIASQFTTPPNVEISVRNKDDREILFVLNHNPTPVTVELNKRPLRNLLTGESVIGMIALDGYGVTILVED